MKCNLCSTEMEKGHIRDGLRWVKGDNPLVGWWTKPLFNSNVHNVDAYRCTNCGKVDLTTEVKKTANG